MSSTITHPLDEERAPSHKHAPARLAFVANSELPEEKPSSHSLDGITEVRFRRAIRDASRHGTVLTLTFPDHCVSTEHGELRLRDGQWHVSDPASKNGTVVNGRQARCVALDDGAVIEIGRSCLVFRRASGSPACSHLLGDVGASALSALPPGMQTFHPGLAHQLDVLLKLAPTQISCVLTGESGTGKEVLARAIHTASSRLGELIAVNCGALPADLVEAELFGSRRGAFTGATEDRLGLVRSAERGTLFLDEIGELPLRAQVSLLRVLQDRAVVPIGATQPIPVDLRLIAATLRDLDREVETGGFRTDLLARLTGYSVHLPPLRERREDLGLLLATILPNARFQQSAMRALLRYRWPHNIRELEKVVTVGQALAGSGPIQVAHLPAALTCEPLPQAPRPIEPARVRQLSPRQVALADKLVPVLEAHDGKVKNAADALGVRRAQVYRWIKMLGLDLEALRFKHPSTARTR